MSEVCPGTDHSCAVCSVFQSAKSAMGSTLCDPMDYIPPGSSVHGDCPGKNTRVSCCALFQGIFPTQDSNPGSPALQADSLPSEPPGKLKSFIRKTKAQNEVSHESRYGACCVGGKTEDLEAT